MTFVVDPTSTKKPEDKIWPPHDHWVCTQNGNTCQKPAILAQHSAGWCVDHAYEAGWLPRVNGHKLIMSPATWGWKTAHGMMCTIGRHSMYDPKYTGNHAAIARAAGLTVFACEEHLKWFVPPTQIKVMAASNGVWMTSDKAIKNGLISSHGWSCTSKYSAASVPCSNDGHAVYVFPYNSQGACITHAVMQGFVKVPELLPGKKWSDYHWEAAKVDTQCTYEGCDQPAFAHLKHSKVQFCTEHASVYIAAPMVNHIDPLPEMTPVGIKKVKGSVWQTLVETSVVTFSCTVPDCDAKAVAFEASHKVAMICEKHKQALAGWITVYPASVPHKKSISNGGAQPAISVLARARARRDARKGREKPVTPKTTGRGLPSVDISEAVLYFPFVEDQNKASGYSGGDEDDENYGHAVEKIGLDSKLPLIQAAAEFYLLMDASLCPPSDAQERASRMFKELTGFLAWQMRLYIECACLGEARYAASRVSDADKAKFLQNPKWRKVFETITGGGYDRHTVWTKFPEYAKVFGWGNLMVFTMLIHETLHWRGGGYGGKKWGQCAKTVLQFIRGKLTPEAFVDTAFGLKHNGNIVFDKLWPVHSIEAILDANQRGDMEELVPVAAPEVVEVWRKANEG